MNDMEGNIEHEIIEATLVVFMKTGIQVSDNDWDKLLEVLKGSVFKTILVVSRGDGPIEITVSQMRKAARIVMDKKNSAVVLSSNKKTKALVTAASWIGASVISFDPQSELDLAFDYLNLSQRARNTLKNLTNKV